MYEYKKSSRKYLPELTTSRWVQESGLETMKPGPKLQNWSGEDTIGITVGLSHCNYHPQFHPCFSLNPVLGDVSTLVSCISACLENRGTGCFCSRLFFKDICRGEALEGRE